MTPPTTIELVGTILFAIAVLHTFMTRQFERLAHLQPGHAGLWHLLAEVEVVFGFWSFVFIAFYAITAGTDAPTRYLESLNFTEPMFIFVIMVIAGSKPILQLAAGTVRGIARLIPAPRPVAFYFVALSLTPLLGSFITEPAAMTLAALMLRDHVFAKEISNRLRYLTLGVLFVNVSIGGTLTPYAAPPVLMVAGTWGWDIGFMLSTFGWKAALAAVANALFATLLFQAELRRLPATAVAKQEAPFVIIALHVAFLAGVVVFAHHPVVFMGIFLFFLGVAQAYPRYQERLILREGLLVGFFLMGLVILGTQQRWWLQPALSGMNATVLYFGATALTAITDNAALTYLGSLVEGIDDAFKYALVAGAVTGGGLTVIANAPNPAGFAILRGSFPEGAISPVALFLYALPPTLMAMAAFLFL
ncbi:MAG TPA: putative Na+/H+ antiporter [Burkholderiales bacterium]